MYSDFLGILDVVNLDLTWIVGFPCYFASSFYHRLLAITLTPLVLLSLLGATYFIAYSRHGVNEVRKAEIRRRHVSAIVLVTFLVYSPASTAVFQTFECDKLDDGHYYLRADYSLKCHSASGEPNKWHLAFMVYAGFMILIYPLGIPALYGCALLASAKSRHNNAIAPRRSSRPPQERVMEDESTSYQSWRADGIFDMIAKDLSQPYKPDRFYYEVVECIRRVLLTGVVVFIFPDSVAQVSTTFLIALSFYAVAEFLGPYKSLFDTWISRLGHVVVVLSLFVALLVKLGSSDESEVGEYFLSVALVAAQALMVLAVLAKSAREWSCCRPLLGMTVEVGGEDSFTLTSFRDGH